MRLKAMKFSKLGCIVPALLLGIILQPFLVFAQQPLVITVVTSGTFTNTGKTILQEAYNRVGVPIEFVNYPGERALILSNDGVTDGELFRIDNMNEKYPNLVKVPVSYIPDEAVVFSKIDFTVDGWQSLKSYKIGVRRGNKFVEHNTQKMLRYFAKGEKQMFEMLALDRVDIVVTNRLEGVDMINKLGYAKTIKPLKPPIVTNPLFHYLHKKHAALVPLLASELQAMYEDGTIQQIMVKVEKNLLQ